ELLLSKQEMEMGRASIESALGLKSRVLLFAASDLTAGSKVENELVGYLNSDRKALWERAKKAAYDLINYGTLELEDFGAPNQEVIAENYFAFFKAKDLSSDELIWCKMHRTDVGP